MSTGVQAAAFLAAACLSLLVACIIMLQVNSTATWHQPYGGCKEASSYPDSVGYAECKAHGLLP